MALIKLDNVIQNYPWGSRSSIGTLFGYPNPNNEPQAELWMGIHPNGCSKCAETGEALSAIINKDKQAKLGTKTVEKFGDLPYLFKVLAANTPLSIQVHPSKKNAKIGFDRENKKGIALNAAERNYKDPNHKPELVYALTPYKAMNGFRPITTIIELFEAFEIEALQSLLTELKEHNNSLGLKQFFSQLMQLSGDTKKHALEQLYLAHNKNFDHSLFDEVNQYSREFRQYYNDDIGLFSPLLLNTIELQPGEAMFLFAETPHAYVQGTGLEIMANSDNVLRAGLTPKYIDVPELISNTRFQSITPSDIKLKPEPIEQGVHFPIPVEDFGFEVLDATGQPQTTELTSGEILFCIKGNMTVSSSNKVLSLTAGESIFIGFDEIKYQFEGNGTFARAFN